MMHTFVHREIDPKDWTAKQWDDWWLHVRTNLRQTFGTPQGHTTLTWLMKELKQFGGLDPDNRDHVVLYNFGRHLWSLMGVDTWVNEPRIVDALMALPHGEAETHLRRIHSGERSNDSH